MALSRRNDPTVSANSRIADALERIATVLEPKPTKDWKAKLTLRPWHEIFKEALSNGLNEDLAEAWADNAHDLNPVTKPKKHLPTYPDRLKLSEAIREAAASKSGPSVTWMSRWAERASDLEAERDTLKARLATYQDIPVEVTPT